MGWKSIFIITTGPYAPSAQLHPINVTHLGMRIEVSLVTGVKNDPKKIRQAEWRGNGIRR